MNQKDVTKKLFALLNSPGGRESSTITFADGRKIVGVPHGFHLFNGSSSMDVLDPQTMSSRSYSLDTVTDITTPGFE